MHRRILIPVTTAVFAALAALPPIAAMAQDGAANGTGGGIVVPAIWSIVGGLIGVVVVGVLYLFKRQTGGFDNPEWTAPIEPLYSKELPEDDAFGDEPASAH